jgi:hypothetical protein
VPSRSSHAKNGNRDGKSVGNPAAEVDVVVIQGRVAGEKTINLLEKHVYCPSQPTTLRNKVSSTVPNFYFFF